MIRNLFLIALLGFSPIASAQPGEFKDVEVEGVFFHGFSATVIYLCTDETPWWVDLEGDGGSKLLEAYQSLFPQGTAEGHDYAPLYVVMRGRLEADSSNSDYLGMFIVDDLVEYSADPDAISDCRSQAAR